MAEKVGFSGTRNLLNADVETINQIVGALPKDTVVITGGCVGVDAYVARAAHARALYVITILPADRKQVDPDWATYASEHEEMPPGTTFRDRNMRKVERSDRMVFIPEYAENDPRSQRSGTWMTKRITEAAGKAVEIHQLRP